MSKKYNRTFHLSFSPGATKDDKIAKNTQELLNNSVILTVKMDGSNVCMEHENCFARSHSTSPSHLSFSAFKALHASVKHLIPANVQIFGEWLYAKHSIHYTELPNYFMIFAVRKDDIWLSWNEVKEYAELINCPTVPEIGKFVFTKEEFIEKCILSYMKNTKSVCGGDIEGVVIRNANSFHNDSFVNNVMKWVRPNHVQTDEHWKDQDIVKNFLFK